MAPCNGRLVIVNALRRKDVLEFFAAFPPICLAGNAQRKSGVCGEFVRATDRARSRLSRTFPLIEKRGIPDPDGWYVVVVSEDRQSTRAEHEMLASVRG